MGRRANKFIMTVVAIVVAVSTSGWHAPCQCDVMLARAAAAAESGEHHCCAGAQNEVTSAIRMGAECQDGCCDPEVVPTVQTTDDVRFDLAPTAVELPPSSVLLTSVMVLHLAHGHVAAPALPPPRAPSQSHLCVFLC